MNAHQSVFQSQSKPRQASTFAIIFFLLGAPNIYSVLQQRSRRRTSQPWLMSLQGISLLAAMTLGITSLLTF
ncbi:MAG: hypothetical protein AAGE59_30410 [Cyanobacteria bacterium P01_F01_bin.86]